MTNSTSSRFVILSIQPQHAARIYEGSKLFELRKKVVKGQFSHVFLCENGHGITGCFKVGKIISDNPQKLWKKVGQLGTSRKRFFTYFNGHKKGYALEVLDPVKFESPILPNEARAVHPAFTSPQSALIVQPGHPLYETLRARQTKAYRKQQSVSLERIQPKHRELYKASVIKHIPDHYEEIDTSFADAILATHDRGYDLSGFFTERKEVMTILRGKTPVGFTTLTYKKGGSVKSGPTILLEKYQRKKLGGAARAAIERYAREQNLRKVYCTCPADSSPVIKYLLAAGYRIEAHLEFHYSSTHGELVFGKFVGPNLTGRPMSQIRSLGRGSLTSIEKFSEETLSSDLQEMFQSLWLRVDKRFTQRLISDANIADGLPYDQKPKHLICLSNSKGVCVGAAILLPKRGGAVKAFLLRSTSHQPSLQTLIEECENRAVGLGRRKIYFLHPAGDHLLIDLFASLDYFGEGLLRAPYVEGRDVFVMSKFL